MDDSLNYWIKRTKDRKHGDFFTNIGMVIAKQHGLEVSHVNSLIVREIRRILNGGK